jgi:hypothetical protein
MTKQSKSRSGHADSESLTARTSGWEARTVTASGKPLQPQLSPEEGNEEYRRLLRQSSRAAWERLRSY